jgi:hypothetical protein
MGWPSTRPLGKVPAARAHDQDGGLVVELVLLPFRRDQLDRALDRVDEIGLPLHAVRPRGRVRVLEIGHEAPCSRVERVDHHLALDRARDLNAAVAEIGGDRSDLPVALAHLAGLGEEVRPLAGLEPLLSLHADLQQLLADGVEAAMQPGDELERLVGEDVLGAAFNRRAKLDPFDGDRGQSRS